MDASSPAVQVLSPIERMKTTAQLMGLVKERQTVKGSDPATALRAARVASQIVALLRRLGAGMPTSPAREAFALEGGPDLPAKPRVPTAQHYDFDPNRPHAQRKKDNAAAMELLRMIDAGQVPPDLNDDQKAILAKYSGTGGNLVGADGKKGSAYEYYTPKPIAKGMWDLLREMGFRGGKVLDPCSGVGIFGATAPPNAAIEAVELNETSGRINQLVNGGPGFNAIVSPFEAVATRTADEIYDAVVSNVPFGGVHDRGANRKIDLRYQDQPLETYFILRSLEKLKPGGLAAFIVPPRIVSGKGGREEQLRIAMSYMAEFRGAYRLPNSVFGSADADTITDVIVLRKFARPVLEKIAELREQQPQTLVDAMVQWTEFISGDYFKGEGRRFVLGQFQAKDPNKFRDVDRVISDQSVGNIAKLLRKFGDSRINWDLLNATETQPLEYADGDTITLAGQTLEMRDGIWVSLDRPPSDDRFDGLGQVLSSATVAATNRVSWSDASDYVTYLRARSLDMEMPIWLRAAHADIAGLKESDRPGYWQALVAGLAAVEVTQTHAATAGFNYLDEYPVVSEAIQVAAPLARKGPAAFSRDSKAALVKVGIVFNRKTGFSALWRGEVKTDVTAGQILSEDNQVEAVKYISQAPTMEIGALQAIYGEDFNPIERDDWCVNADGTMATKADDYYVGNLGEFLRRIDAEIASAPPGPLRDKLLRQKTAARDRVATVDPSGLRFNLFSPFVDIEEKAEFMRRFFHPAFTVAYDDDGTKVIVCDIGSPKTEQERQLKRLAEWMKKGNLSTRTSKEEAEKSPELERARIDMLRQMVQKANAQFDQWVKSNPLVMERLRATANDPERIYFREVDNNSPLSVEGMSDGVRLHGYQNAFVRKMARSFGGINGFDVGLGKAQPLDAKIMTPDGWKRMGDMRVGDLVIAVDGTAVPVTGVYPQGEKEIFEVEFSDGASTRCCDEHLWLTKTESDRKIERYNRRLGRQVERRGSVKSLAEIRSSLIYQTQKNHQIPLVEPIQFAARDLPVRPYLMGVLLGDGNMTHGTTSFTTVDGEIASRVAHLLRDGFGDEACVVPRASGSRAQTYGISRARADVRNPVRAELDRYGLVGKGSPFKFIPDDYLMGSVDQRVELLRGLMDADGYVSQDGVTVQFASTSRMLAEGVRSLVQSLGGIAWINSKTPTYRYRGEKLEGRKAFTVAIRMPATINPFALERKAQRVKPKSKYLPVRYFTGVRSIGMAPAQCISIDHPSRLYVTDDYIVTHNTFTALASMQYVQSIGVKKKTMIVVPNTVLSNWRREAGRAYASLDDCLFVGLDVGADGKARVDPANYARDFTIILENRHRKIFCTLEAFKAIPLRPETLEAYDRYLMSVDPSYADAERKADSERASSKRAEATSGAGAKSSAIPYFEDMGIDSLVMDEAHQFKNSKNTVEFSGAKFLSVAEASQRGLDIQMKAWYVRGLSPLRDGVLALTATPITNSPLEIYSMLCLAVGEEKVHNLCMGARGADAFMSVMCDIVQEDEATIDGRIKPYNVFRGLQNVDLLRNALATVATIKNASDVKDGGDDLRLPEAPENKTAVQLTPATLNTLTLYKGAYRAARAIMRDQQVDPADLEALAQVTQKFGEPPELIGHPFNLINKMTLLIADPDLDQRATFYKVLPNQADEARAAVAAFNKLGRVEVRMMAGPWTAEEAVIGQKTVKDGDSETVMVRIRVEAKTTDDGRVVLDTMDHTLQTEFEALAEKAGLDLDCSIPPKLAALLENVRREEGNPRSASGRVKQLIFCDILPMHAKIKRLLVKHAGVSASAIVIVSGQTIKNPEQMQGVQDGFNAEGDDNRYRIVIANEKAEVGINLQKGTQAIHHLTIGWTPDSTIQRNGRGVRQGNTTARVNIYVYDADGTFDEYKRTLTSKKADWIGSVMDTGGGNDIQIAGGLTSEEYDELINSVGDADALRAIRERAELKERRQRAESARVRQVINVQTAESQRRFLEKFDTADKWIVAKAMDLYDLRASVRTMEFRAEGKVSANSLIKLQTRIAELKARAAALERELNESATFTTYTYDPATRQSKEVEVSVLDVLKPSRTGQTGAKLRDSILESLKHRTKARDDGPLINEYQSERDQAQAMVDEAHKDFARIAASSEGGYSEEMLAAVKSGQAAVLDGKLFARGMFVRDKKGALGILMDGTTIVRVSSGGRQVAVADAVREGWTFIAPGEDGYEAALHEGAKLDDAAGDLSHDFAQRLFSRINPAVAAHRKRKTMVQYRDATAVRLPAPYFQYPIDGDAPGVSEAFKSIAAKQAGVVTWGDGIASIASDVEVTVDTTYRSLADKVAPLKDYALANGLRLKATDFAVLAWGRAAMASLSHILPSLSPLADWPDNWAEFNEADDIEQLQAKLVQIVKRAAPWLELSASEVEGFISMGGRVKYRAREAAIKALQERAAQAAEAARRAAEVPTTAVQPTVGADTGEGVITVAGVTANAKGLIGLQGNTKPNKEIIKAAARDAGGYARWNGTAGQWDVPAKTWAVLTARHPTVAQQLQVVPA